MEWRQVDRHDAREIARKVAQRQAIAVQKLSVVLADTAAATETEAMVLDADAEEEEERLEEERRDAVLTTTSEVSPLFCVMHGF